MEKEQASKSLWACVWEAQRVVSCQGGWAAWKNIPILGGSIAQSVVNKWMQWPMSLLHSIVIGLVWHLQA